MPACTAGEYLSYTTDQGQTAYIYHDTFCTVIITIMVVIHSVNSKSESGLPYLLGVHDKLVSLKMYS
jgi:hypothetical protein